MGWDRLPADARRPAAAGARPVPVGVGGSYRGAVGRPLVEQLKESPDAAIRRTAIYLLRELGVSEATPELQELVGRKA